MWNCARALDGLVRIKFRCAAAPKTIVEEDLSESMLSVRLLALWASWYQTRARAGCEGSLGSRGAKNDCGENLSENM